jgi:hypothetical protein
MASQEARHQVAKAARKRQRTEPGSITFLRDGAVFELRAHYWPHHQLFEVGLLDCEEDVMEDSNTTRSELTIAVRYCKTLGEARAEIGVGKYETRAGEGWLIANEEPPPPPILPMDPRDACLDEIAEILRGTENPHRALTQSEMGEIKRIVSSMGRKI